MSSTRLFSLIMGAFLVQGALWGQPAVPPEAYDVVVAGAGTGGFGVAVQAARLGASVLLLEETDWIGGQMTAAAVTSMDEGPGPKERPYVLVRERGLYHEFAAEVTTYYQSRGINADTAYWNARLGMEPHVGLQLLYRMLGAARSRTSALDVCLRSKVVKVHRASEGVTGVDVETVTPRGTVTRRVRSKVLVDATEWGDVLPLTGARYRVGNCAGENPDSSRAIQDLTWAAVVKQYTNGVPAELRMSQPPPGYHEAMPRFAKSLVAGDKGNTAVTPWSFATFIGYRAMPNSEQPQTLRITRTHLNYNNDYPVAIRDVEDTASRLATCRKAQLRTLQPTTPLLYPADGCEGLVGRKR